MTSLRTVRLLIQILTGCALLGAAISAVAAGAFIAKAQSTTGTIVAVETRPTDSGDLVYRPTFVFTASGQDYQISLRSYVAPSPGDVGDAVPVLYDPRNPRQARIDSFVYTWFVPMLLLALAAVFGLIHFAFAAIARLLSRSSLPDDCSVGPRE